MPLWAFLPKPPGTDNAIENKLKAGANEGTLLRKQSFVQDAKTVFGKLKKHFLLSRRRFCVFNICCLRVQTENHLGNIEETLTLNVSRLFPCLRTQVTYIEDAEFATRKQKISCFLPVCSPVQHYEQHRFTLLSIIPRTVLLSSIQLEAETLDFSTHAIPRNL